MKDEGVKGGSKVARGGPYILRGEFAQKLTSRRCNEVGECCMERG